MLKGRALRGVEGSAQRASVLAGRRGVNMANKGGGQDLRAMWKLYLAHWPLWACTGPAAIHLAVTVSTVHYKHVSPNFQKVKSVKKWCLLTIRDYVRISCTIQAFNEVSNKGLINGPVNVAPPWPQSHKSSLGNMTTSFHCYSFKSSYAWQRSPKSVEVHSILGLGNFSKNIYFLKNKIK